MRTGSHSLHWYPRTQQIERSSGSLLPLSSTEAFAIHRRLGPDLGFGKAVAEIGRDLLPDAEQPAYGASIQLLWVPLLPSQCLLTAQNASGGLQVAACRGGPASDQLASALEHMEVECGWAFDEAFAEPPNDAEVIGHLEAALELSAFSVLLFCEQVSSPPFWQRAAS